MRHVHDLVQYVGYVNLALFTAVAVVAILQWRARRSRAGIWAALAFGALALVVDAAEALPEDPDTAAEWLARRALIAVLVLFPYLLYRFTTAFREPTRRLERLFGVMTAALLVWTFALPEIPQEGEPRSAGFVAFLVAFLAHWTILSIVVALRLLHAGGGQPSVARRRMHLLAGAATLTTVILLASAFTPEASPGLELAYAFMSTASALGFLTGLAPPRLLRMLWRRPEQQRLQEAVTSLMGAVTEDEVARAVLPPMARIVGARTVALRRKDGSLIGAYGAGADAEADVREAAEGEAILLPVPSGTLEVWTSPYAPYFGSDELQLLKTLGALTGLALDRSRLFAQEREARAALERADEVKTNFVALAAHELRTPVATIDGIIQTLARRRELTDEQRQLLERTLVQQSAHMRRLVDQLLDLSRLDADAVRIEPQPLAVREQVEAAVRAAAGPRAADVRIEVDDHVYAVADPTALERIVSNLVTNAFRYGELPVVIRAEQRDRHFRLSVEDDGPGVPPDFVPDLFERFTRSGASRERVIGGTGLGLAIARSYANAHGGDLIYAPREPKGSRFELVLPVDRRRNGA
jgi:signal transduction histidine kinase